MRAWAILLGGLLIWAGHFFILYGIAEFAGDDAVARGAIVAITLACLVAELLVLRACLRDRPADRWRGQVGALGAVLGLVAIVWQAFPPFF